MMLEHIEIKDFRGIAYLSLPFKQVMLLIGENTWGKSSLLDALSLSLSPQAMDYRFTSRDFFLTRDNSPAPRCHILLTLTFGAEADALPDSLKTLLTETSGGGRVLRYGVYAVLEEGQPRQYCQFPDRSDLSETEASNAAESLRRLFPVLRLRDARFNARQPGSHRRLADATYASETAEQLTTLSDRFADPVRGVSASLIRQALETLYQLADHYFRIQRSAVPVDSQEVASLRNDLPWQQLSNLSRRIAAMPESERDPWLLELFSAVLQPQPTNILSDRARPILLLEDPETRLHPRMLSVTWEFLSLLPLQKIVTTNSAELLSMVTLESICRLDRGRQSTTSRQLSAGQLPSDELRKITFHIQVNRPSALFARCWLLVEGETEVWMINELARQSGLSLTSEGICVVEFAQAGLKPLLKYARLMGIPWHVLTDGDEAGNKYAAVAQSQLAEQQQVRHHLTRFPAKDIEHYFYRQGFADIYRQIAGLSPEAGVNMHRVITRAIQRSSKPSLAIAVASAVADRGVQSIPMLLRKMLGRVRGLAQGKHP
ncbi:DUF2813 domain-containing protein [Tatumella citrea]|uniref:OLD protein-like TOPRIM domain-containing protein n=1 Tax=Tatumella citrea TaxID=53336 RepID=A0A1Y0LIC5_TATCI|nr:DUF2813 domain-containing protein [Tatumella citrea]ARU93496.1 hypothetical protein A7K98_06700 [Tatumella citrea]ARU97535.1 hypothetical protein A7K99_06700 [Tatumella citrea]